MYIIKIADKSDFYRDGDSGNVIMTFPLPVKSREKVDRIKNGNVRELAALAEILKLRLFTDCGIPCDVPIEYGIHGKPYIAACDAAYDVAFNISHSKNLVAGAILTGEALGGGRLELGVDIQYIDRGYNSEKMNRFIKRYYTEGERELIFSSPDPMREYISVWSRKEAYIKYTGEGLTHPLKDVDTVSGTGDTYIKSRGIYDAAGNEYMLSVCVPVTYAGKIDSVMPEKIVASLP